MKRHILLILVMLIMSVHCIYGNIDFQSIDVTTLPEYIGTLPNPECLVVYRGDGYVIVSFQGKYYVYYQK